MALPATDDFNRADGGLGSNWTVTSGAFEIVSNQVKADDGANECFAVWNADEFPDDHYSEITIVSRGDDDYIGLGVRMSLVAETAAVVGFTGSSRHFHVWVNGSRVVNSIPNANPGAGDRLRLEAEGTTVRVLVNGDVTDTFNNPTGLQSSGGAGIRGFRTGGNSVGDDWEGGAIGEVPAEPDVIPGGKQALPRGFSGHRAGRLGGAIE